MDNNYQNEDIKNNEPSSHTERQSEEYPGDGQSVRPSGRDIKKYAMSRRYAGFWMRFWAYLLDLLIVFSLNGLILSPLMFLDNQPVNILGFFTLQGILSAITSYLYFLFMTKWLGQTLGKMIFGLKVVHKDAAPLTWPDLLFREVVGRFIYRSLVITNIIYIVVGFTNEKQGIHDMFGDTRVIHVDK
ncbi:RDD family protein [Alteribacillus sp. JSM 102045]|uniref:RDD family protein n=1 Tax=Alteribacillus sp. JSM 102045 TaxID=1562101 RepID=UPI0035BF7E3E